MHPVFVLGDMCYPAVYRDFPARRGGCFQRKREGPPPTRTVAGVRYVATHWQILYSGHATWVWAEGGRYFLYSKSSMLPLTLE